MTKEIEDSLDYSTLDFPEDRIWFRIPEWEVILKVTTFVPVIVFGIASNLIIVYLIIQNRALRTPTNMLIANMAVADTAALLICPIMFMYNDFFQNYMMGPFGCKTEGFLQGSLLITAVLNLSGVSYDRLTAIVLPLEARLTIKGAKVVMVVTWLIGFVIATPLAIFRIYKVRLWKNFRESYCKENQYILPKYWYFLISALVWFPLAVMVISYTAILIKLDLYEKKVLSRDHPLNVSYKKTAAKTMFIVVVVFIVLRVPFTVLVFIRADLLGTYTGATNNYRTLWYIAHYLMFLNAAVNPIIYGYTNDNFRRAYDQTPMFRCFSRTRITKKSTENDRRRNSSCCCYRLCNLANFRRTNIEMNMIVTKTTRSPIGVRAITKETMIDSRQTFNYIHDVNEVDNGFI
ncbi:neuropeptide FF receptor 2 [Episyrphus balteatus]|uniref:neuropeptide FF receptor 2 n=1 Tax=Episyrphus balteatus TaxID=286459 RepID=UPI0024851583|nr:neuropeptide FF receptor 2 [Episyrphus balteatus]